MTFLLRYRRTRATESNWFTGAIIDSANMFRVFHFHCKHKIQKKCSEQGHKTHAGWGGWLYCRINSIYNKGTCWILAKGVLHYLPHTLYVFLGCHDLESPCRAPVLPKRLCNRVCCPKQLSITSILPEAICQSVLTRYLETVSNLDLKAGVRE